MLPSMPVLFTRESQDAFGNKIVPSTSELIIKNVIHSSNPTQIQQQTQAQFTDNDELKLMKGEGTKSKEPMKDKTTPEVDEDTFENALVASYYDKVQSRFGSNNNKFLQFQNMLKTFDPSKMTPIDLYKSLEELLGEENSDLVEEFLLFLTPVQAAQIGRSMDRLMLSKMTKFLDLLQSTFSRKPTMLRKIMRAITNSLNGDNLNQMRAKVLPHLRSSPRLTVMFKSLFPDNVPPDSLYENNTDMFNENFLTADKGYDVWEFDEPLENRRNLCAKEGIDTKYLQGRVFLQYGKILKASKVTYPYSKEPYRVHMRRLAPAHCRLSPPTSDEEVSSPRRNTNTNKTQKTKRTKKTQPKSPCVRNLLKDVNDNNKHNAKEQPAESNAKVSNVLTKTNKLHNSISHINDKNKTQDNKSTDATDKRDAKGGKPTKDKADTTKLTQAQTRKKDGKQQRDKNDNKPKSNLESKKEEAPKSKRPKIEVVKTKAEVKLTRVKTENSSWTRDEDKAMLEMLQGAAGSERIFCKIKELLPHRSMTEIRERFSHVMNLLNQMSLGEVT